MELKEIFREFCDQNQIPVLKIKSMEEEADQFGIMINGENGNWEAFTMCYEQEKLFVFLINLGVRVPLEARERVAVLLNKINYQLKCGGFFLDVEDGYVIARATQYIYGTDGEKASQVENCIKACAVITDAYFKNIMKESFQN